MYKIIFESVIHLSKCYIKLCYNNFFIANNFDDTGNHSASFPCLPFLQVFYHTCPEITWSFAKFPTTPTNAQVTGIGALAVLYILTISMGLRWMICSAWQTPGPARRPRPTSAPGTAPGTCPRVAAPVWPATRPTMPTRHVMVSQPCQRDLWWWVNCAN